MNVVCIAQCGYIKEDRTKSIIPKFFFSYELQEGGEKNVRLIRSFDDLTDLFTKTLSNAILKK
jgi:hypothetical protein